MDKSRFSLLLLEPGEIYLEDYSSTFIPPETTRKSYELMRQEGRLKICTKSLIFEPKSVKKPLIKLRFNDCIIIEEWKGSAKFIEHRNNALSINCKEYTEILEGNIFAPYKIRGNEHFLFLLNYSNIVHCLNQTLKLFEANLLPTLSEQNNMIGAIVKSHNSKIQFNPLWLDLDEKILIEDAECDKISPLNTNPGRCVLTPKRVYFQPYNNIEESYPVIKIQLKTIQRIVKRRFLLRHIGLEIYSQESSTLYLAFKNATKRDKFHETLLNKAQELNLENLDQTTITLQWQNGIISNYDYLLYLNSLADRTVNDLTQYPVFPWIISNYETESLDLEDSRNFRDLSKPIGALNAQRLNRLKERFEEMMGTTQKFLYGSHYSTPGFVLYYLARFYPNYVLCMQSGRFDHPDRMFNSVRDTFTNCLTNMSDFKELIPEFYENDGGGFLCNKLGINFGVRYNGMKVGDVELPSWGKTPKKFVEIQRKALESDFVSQNLNLWIDLIFGAKQRGLEAIKANNLFYPLCYEGNVDLDGIVDETQRHALEVQIMEFGQIPKQIFTVPHPQRKIFHLVDNHDMKKPHFGTLEMINCFCSHKMTVSSVKIDEFANLITSVSHDSKMKQFSLAENRQIRSSTIGKSPLSDFIRLPGTSTLILATWDNQILFYDLDYGRVTLDDGLAHEDAVICLKLLNKRNFLISGSADCSVRIWRNFTNLTKNLTLECLYKHLDHASAVRCIAIQPYYLCSFLFYIAWIEKDTRYRFIIYAVFFFLSFFCRDESHFVVGTADGEIYLWQVEEEFKLVKKYEKFKENGEIRAMIYSPEDDGQKLAVGTENGRFFILEVETGLIVFKTLLNSSVTALEWKNDILIIGCQNGLLLLWNMFEVVLFEEIQAHSSAILTVQIEENSAFIVSGGEDRCIKVWNNKK